MDSFSHALAAAMICLGAGIPTLIPAAALGAIAPDIDVLFPKAFDSNPHRYLFTHGGITHSIAGSLLTAAAFYICTSAVISIPPGFFPFFPAWSLPAVMACMGGSLTHIFFDLLACPGIPVLAPLSDRKYTAAIFPGPSLVLFAMSTFIVALFLLGGNGTFLLTAYIPFFVGTILLRTVLKVVVALTTAGKAIPTFNPLRWIVIREDEREFRVSIRKIPGGEREIIRSSKYLGVQANEAESVARDPRVNKLRYNSYFVTAERDGDSIIFRDPLREEGVIFYPPTCTRVAIPFPPHLPAPREGEEHR